jgi:hypothetical protein
LRAACQEAKELAARRVEGPLFSFRLAMEEKRPAIVANEVEYDVLDQLLAEAAVELQSANDLAAKNPNVVTMLTQDVRDNCRFSRWWRNGVKYCTICRPRVRSPGSYAQLLGHRSRSGQEVCSGSAPTGCTDRLVTLATRLALGAMRLISLLNHYQHFPGFVYEKARLCARSQTIELAV